MSEYRTEEIAKIAELAKDVRTAMLTTIDQDGTLVSRPMGLQEVDADGDLWFFLDAGTPKARDVEGDSRVNVSFSSGSTWVSVSGHGTLVRDRARMDQMWNPFVEAWFPDGPQTPGLALLHVASDSAEYWDTPSGKAVQLIAMAKAKLTGQRFEGTGTETAVVDLT